MVWPLVAIAVGVSALGLRAGIRALRKANIQVPSPSSLPFVSALHDMTADRGGFASPMTSLEACQILNISPTTPKDKVRENHKQLMMRNHPDNGGSTYVAAKVNEAKDLLLKN